MNNPDSRNFAFLLYPDEDEIHKKAMLQLSFFDSVAWCVHDQDVNSETGEILKPHTHIVLMLDKRKHLEQLCAELGITSNYCRCIVGNRRQKLRYLIHFDNPEKHQYNINDVQGSIDGLRKFKYALRHTDTVDEGEIISEILNFVESRSDHVTIRQIIDFSIDNGFYSVFRRNFNVIKYLLDLRS